MSTEIQWIQLEHIHPHPRNPRLVPRTDVVDAIAAQLTDGFDPAHALIVRPNNGSWENVSGHHRALAAQKAGLKEVPCWVRELDDASAYMLLATSNSQGELTALERGMHALHSGMDVKAYAASIGRKRTTVQNEVKAARVAGAVTDIGHVLSSFFSHLVEIYAALPWLWPALVAHTVDKKLLVETTRTVVSRLKNGLPNDRPSWLGDVMCAGLVDGTIPVRDISRVKELLEKTHIELESSSAEIIELTGEDPNSVTLLLDEITFDRYSIALEYCNKFLEDARNRLTTARQENVKKQYELEESAKQAIRYHDNVSLEEWRTLDDQTRRTLLDPDNGSLAGGSFNKQDSTSIEWAMWSWNPVTGCEHTCSYCYAREIATSGRMSSAYPHGFAPTLHPKRVQAPRTMKVPAKADGDTRYKNVFTGSMSDMFGRWVPEEWILAVLSEIRQAPQWNFLCLTKFPKRMAEFDIPTNAWMGTTVDLQARVTAAEEGFKNIGAGVKWLSCEPLIEPLHFKHLDRFNWIVIGGASRTSKTPEWRPPFEWIIDLVKQARDAGLKVYFKTNLLSSRILELPFDAPIEADPTEAPAIFHYLQSAKGV